MWLRELSFPFNVLRDTTNSGARPCGAFFASSLRVRGHLRGVTHLILLRLCFVRLLLLSTCLFPLGCYRCQHLCVVHTRIFRFEFFLCSMEKYMYAVRGALGASFGFFWRSFLAFFATGALLSAATTPPSTSTCSRAFILSLLSAPACSAW